MNLEPLFKAQNDANKSFVLDETLNDYKLTARILLHLHVKIGGLANETQCFKYWQDQSTVSDDIIVTKYMDCLRHILTVGLNKKYDSLTEVQLNPSEYCLSDQFLNLFIDINDITISPSMDHYITLLEDFLSLGVSLGYSEAYITDFFHSNIKSDLN